MSAAIRLHDLTVGYDRRPVVRRLSGSFAAGSLTAIVGPNGAGKTTLLKAIMGLLRPAAGRVDVAGGAAALAYLPQRAELDCSFPIAVRDVVELGHWRRVGPFGAIGREGRLDAERAVELVGLGGYAKRPIGELSAGQLQRALFARLVVQDAPVILLDEPFAAVDARTTADLMTIVARWGAEGRTIAIVAHDLAQLRASCPQTLLLAQRAIAWGPTERVMTADNLLRAWGVELAPPGAALALAAAPA